MTEISTCAESLTNAGTCCCVGCDDPAVSATIGHDLVEHTRCASHDHGPDVAARKPLRWSDTWRPQDTGNTG